MTSGKHIGFTGTRSRMTEPQAERVGRTIATAMRRQLEGWFHHGDCVGADEQAHHLARSLGLRISVHPPSEPGLRARCAGDILHEPKGYIERNHDIVDACVGLIAAPSGFEEELRSGTWATVRYARQVGRPLVIVFPDGTTRNEAPPRPGEYDAATLRHVRNGPPGDVLTTGVALPRPPGNVAFSDDPIPAFDGSDA